jgi:hypothetical protein
MMRRRCLVLGVATIGAAFCVLGAGCEAVLGVGGLHYTQGDGSTGGDGASSCPGVPLGTDQHNCGACGHDCLGGACDGGVCQPVLLASGVITPTAIAVDAQNVYFTTNQSAQAGTVSSVPIDGGPVTDLVTGQETPDSLAIDGSHLYWTTGDGYARWAPKAADGGGGTQLANTLGDTAFVAADGNSVCVVTGTVIECGPTPPNGVTVMGPSGGLPGGIALGSGSAFWVLQGSIDAGTVLSAPTQGSVSPTTVVPGNGGAFGIAVDSTTVYWTTRPIGNVMAVPLVGGTPVTLAMAQDSPNAIAVDSTHVYWTNVGQNGAVMINALDAGPGAASTLVGNLGEPLGIAVDDVAVYWTDRANGVVMKVAKP